MLFRKKRLPRSFQSISLRRHERKTRTDETTAKSRLNEFGRKYDSALNVVQKLFGTTAAVVAAGFTIYITWTQASLQKKIVEVQEAQLSIQAAVNEPIYKIQITSRPADGVMGYQLQNSGSPVLDGTVRNFSFWAPSLACTHQGKTSLKKSLIPLQRYFSAESDRWFGIPIDSQSLFWGGNILNISPWGIKSQNINASHPNLFASEVQVLFEIEYTNRLRHVGTQYLFGSGSMLGQISPFEGKALVNQHRLDTRAGYFADFLGGTAEDYIKLLKTKNLSCNG